MAFEKFVPPRKPKPPQVSIKRTGTITFDNALAATYGFTKVSHAILYFDPAKKLVGVRPALDPKARGIACNNRNGRVSVVAVS